MGHVPKGIGVIMEAKKEMTLVKHNGVDAVLYKAVSIAGGALAVEEKNFQIYLDIMILYPDTSWEALAPIIAKSSSPLVRLQKTWRGQIKANGDVTPCAGCDKLRKLKATGKPVVVNVGDVDSLDTLMTPADRQATALKYLAAQFGGNKEEMMKFMQENL